VTRRTVPDVDPVRLEAEADEYARTLAAEAERDLQRHPERRRYARAADPDRHRRRVPPRPSRDPGRGAP